MHVITQKFIWAAKLKFPKSASALDNWYRTIKKNSFDNYAELKKSFNSVDKVGEYFIFDVAGNKIRIITNINFKRRKIYLRDILTHIEYEKDNWKKRSSYATTTSKSY